MKMNIGASKENLVETLDHFCVNRVKYYSLKEALKYPDTKPFGVRSKVPGGNFYYGITPSEIALFLHGLQISSVTHYACDSLIKEDERHLIYNAEVLIYKNSFGVWGYDGFVNTDRGISLREASRNPKRFIKTRHDIPRRLHDYLWACGIIGFVVEVSAYDIPVGIKNEGLIFWEIRRY